LPRKEKAVFSAMGESAACRRAAEGFDGPAAACYSICRRHFWQFRLLFGNERKTGGKIKKRGCKMRRNAL